MNKALLVNTQIYVNSSTLEHENHSKLHILLHA